MVNKSWLTKTRQRLKKRGDDSSKKLRVMELFAGVGGFHVGFDSVKAEGGISPFHVIWANQWEPAQTEQHAFKVYKRHFPNPVSHDYANESIAEFTKALAEKKIGKRAVVPEHDVLCGGFPCQDYSVAKPRNNSHGIKGKKGVLWWDIHAILKHAKKKPKYIVLENVDRLLKSPIKTRGRDFAIMLASLNMLGYIVEWRVIDASQYGYPQRRKRIFLLARKSRAVTGTRFGSVPQVSKILTRSGLLAKAFPVATIDTIVAGKLYGAKNPSEAKVLHKLTLEFNHDNVVSPFHNAGIAYKGQYWTARVHPKMPSTLQTLGDILQPAANVPEDFYVSSESMPRWKQVKGAKRVMKASKKSGIEYLYAEGAIAFPDLTSKPSRTVVTSEGGKTASRMKHIIKRGRRYRRLTPIELERLNGFPDNHTAAIPDTRRAFLMGNALVVGCVSRIGNAIANNEGWKSHINKSVVKSGVRKNAKRKKRRRDR